MYDPLLMIFIGAISLASILSIYLIAKAKFKSKKEIERAEKKVEELGLEIDREELKKILKEELKTDIEDELRALAEKQAEKRLKKATRGLHKAKGQKIILVFENNKLGEENKILGKLHSYDRLSLDGLQGYYVFYYFPLHNSIFLNGIQALISIFGRGKKRLEVPEELIMSIGTKAVIIRAKTLQTIDANTFRVVPPEELEPVVTENRYLRKKSERLKELLEETLNDMKKVEKLALLANPNIRRDYLWWYLRRYGEFDEELLQEKLSEEREVREDRLKLADEALDLATGMRERR